MLEQQEKTEYLDIKPEAKHEDEIILDDEVLQTKFDELKIFNYQNEGKLREGINQCATTLNDTLEDLVDIKGRRSDIFGLELQDGNEEREAFKRVALKVDQMIQDVLDDSDNIDILNKGDQEDVAQLVTEFKSKFHSFISDKGLIKDLLSNKEYRQSGLDRGGNALQSIESGIKQDCHQLADDIFENDEPNSVDKAILFLESKGIFVDLGEFDNRYTGLNDKVNQNLETKMQKQNLSNGFQECIKKYKYDNIRDLEKELEKHNQFIS